MSKFFKPTVGRVVLSIILCPILLGMGIMVIFAGTGGDTALGFLSYLFVVFAPVLLLGTLDNPIFKFIHNSWTVNLLIQFVYAYLLLSLWSYFKERRRFKVGSNPSSNIVH